MPVLKQTSPTGAGSAVCAPKPRPQNTVPSASTNAAVAPVGVGPPSGGVGSVRGATTPPDRSDKARPVAAITAAQWRDGIDPAWRHLRTASVPTPVRRAAASAPPRRSTTESTLNVMRGTVWEVISQRNNPQASPGNFLRPPQPCHFAYSRESFFVGGCHEPARAVHRSAQGVDEGRQRRLVPRPCA